MTTPTRDSPLGPGTSGLLVIDMQYLCAARGHGTDRDRPAVTGDYYFSRLEGVTVPNLEALLGGFRSCGIEILYSVIESLTRDGRDRSLDHKLTGYHAAPGSREGEVIESLAPRDDEIVFRKTASGVFNATNIDYVLRNMGIERLAIAGVYTNKCVESAVRDAADLGYLVTVVEDACAAPSAEDHAASLNTMMGYARITSTADVLAEIGQA